MSIESPRDDDRTQDAGERGNAAAAALPDVVRVTAKLPGRAVEQLRRNAAQQGDTLTQGLKAAISTKLFLDETLREGGTVLVRKKDGTLMELILP